MLLKATVLSTQNPRSDFVHSAYYNKRERDLATLLTSSSPTIQSIAMKYIVLAVVLILQLQTATCCRCTDNNTKDEILDEVHLMLSEMETKLLSQIHVSTNGVI